MWCQSSWTYESFLFRCFHSNPLLILELIIWNHSQIMLLLTHHCPSRGKKEDTIAVSVTNVLRPQHYSANTIVPTQTYLSSAMFAGKVLRISDPEENIFCNTELSDGWNVLTAGGVLMTYQQLTVIVVAKASTNQNIFDVTSVERLLVGKIFLRITYSLIQRSSNSAVTSVTSSIPKEPLSLDTKRFIVQVEIWPVADMSAVNWCLATLPFVNI